MFKSYKWMDGSLTAPILRAPAVLIISHNSTINLCTTNMAAESFVKPKKCIAGISDLAALARHSLGS